MSITYYIDLPSVIKSLQSTKIKINNRHKAHKKWILIVLTPH